MSIESLRREVAKMDLAEVERQVPELTAALAERHGVTFPEALTETLIRLAMLHPNFEYTDDGIIRLAPHLQPPKEGQ